MAYGLIVPVCIYMMLAALVYRRQPGGLSNRVLIAYLFCVSLTTAGYLVLGTTTDRSLAALVVVIILLVLNWIYPVLVPTTLFALYFETWFRRAWRWLVGLACAIVLLLDWITFLLVAASPYPLVYRVETGYWVLWVVKELAGPWLRNAAVVLAVQLPTVSVIGLALHHRRMSLWREAVPFTLAALFNLLIIPLSVLTGPDWAVTVTALSHAPLVLLLAMLFVQAGRQVSLESLVRTTLQGYTEGLLVLDAQRRVVWHNAQVTRYLGKQSEGRLVLPSLWEVVGGTPFMAVARRVLDMDGAREECPITIDGDEYVIEVSVEPLPAMHDWPDARLLVFRDITASHMRRDLEERRRELRVLSAISADISSSLDMNQVIERALQQVVTALDMHDSLVYLVDPADPDHLRLAGQLVTSHPAPPYLEREAVDASVSGQVVLSRQIMVISDVDHDPEWGRFLLPYGLKAAASMPLIVRDQVIGVLQIGKMTPHTFDEVEIALLESVGRQLAIAIENARLHSEERRQHAVAEALREVANIVSSKTIDEALQAVLNQLGRIIDHTRATVLLMAEPGQLSVRASIGFEPLPDQEVRAIRVRIDQYPYLVRMFEEQRAQFVPNTQQNPAWVQGAVPIGSWIGVPLIMRGQMLGCLSVIHAEPGHFTAADVHLAQAVADQLVVAIENAGLFENEQRRRVRAELLQQMSYELVTSPDLDTACAVALKRLHQMVAYDRAHIGLIDEERQVWLPRAWLGYQDDRVSLIQEACSIHDFPLIQRIIETRRGILVSDSTQQPAWRSTRFDVPQPVRSWVGAPLIVRDRVIGILNVDSYRSQAFSSEDFQSIQLLANWLATIFENFRLLDEANHQNRILSALNSVLATSSAALAQENLLGVLLERVLDALGLSAGVIHQVEPVTGDLVLRAAVGVSPALVKVMTRLPQATDFSTLTWPGADQVAFMSVPLLSHGTVIGLLSVVGGDEQTPGYPALRELLDQMGSQVGVVMDNAILFENAIRREALSTDLGRLGLAISAQLDRQAVLNLICHESMAVFNAQGAYIWLIKQARLVGEAAAGPGAEQFAGQMCYLTDSAILPVRALKEWRPLLANCATEPQVLPPALLEMTGARAAIAVPLLKADIPIGVLLLVNDHDPAAFADWMLDQVGLLGVQAALAIQNATLFDEIRRRLDQLRLVNEVGRYTTAILNLSGLVDGIARKLYSILQYDLIALWQVEEGRLVPHSIFVQGELLPPLQINRRYKALEDVALRAVRQAEPLLDNFPCSLSIQPDDAPGEMGDECCLLAVPLIVADEAIGVLMVERRGANTVTEDDLGVLEPLAAQLAISVSNARLFERVRRQTIDLEARVAERTAEIRHQQERTEAILRSVADAVIVLDLGGHVVMTNPVARELFERVDQGFELSQRIAALAQQAMEGSTPVHEVTEVIELGKLALQAKASRVVEGEQVWGWVVVVRDISRFRELDRLKDGFVSNVSHELRTPLANLKLYLSLLHQGRPERQANYLEVMGREIERLERLIGDLLDLSRLQSEHQAARAQVRQMVDLEALINRVIQNHSAWAESRGDELRYEGLAAPLPYVWGNPDQIVRALTNLVSNAINYTPPGGRVLVRSQVEQIDSPEHDGLEWVIIEVTDTGIGIPSEDLPSIFERFYRGSNVDPNIPGTGLGLAIIKEIVELHGGQIEVESEPGVGSSFRLRLPALRQA